MAKGNLENRATLRQRINETGLAKAINQSKIGKSFEKSDFARCMELATREYARDLDHSSAIVNIAQIIVAPIMYPAIAASINYVIRGENITHRENYLNLRDRFEKGYYSNSCRNALKLHA